MLPNTNGGMMMTKKICFFTNMHQEEETIEAQEEEETIEAS
jgi:hypothetical protein